MSPDNRFVLGLDVGWSTARRSSAACLFGWDATTITADVIRFTADPTDYQEALAALIGDRRLAAVALDGPLRGDFAEIGIYRTAEMLLTRGFAKHIGKPGQSNSPNGRTLNKTTNAYASFLLDNFDVGPSSHRAAIHRLAIAEAFPTSFLGTMLDAGFREPGRARSDSYFEKLTADIGGCRLTALIARLLPDHRPAFRAGEFTNHDDRAALVCALTALCVALRHYVAAGGDDGWVILPPRSVAGADAGMRCWAWEILSKNSDAAGSQIISELDQIAHAPASTSPGRAAAN